ncbi:DUF2778 domain-containing protein [Chelatococcus sambhunathii]|uniref:DUF2778 domain-containing protein n=1 Tax=Chelatococcus sambhunathii TaxID=363953 RepID=UPI00285250E5|nr:tlde1 domain-containing protein [Chelatococcus sambhunathii]
MILTGAALMLASGASLVAAVAITFAATGNLAVAAAHRPIAGDGWRQARRAFEAPRLGTTGSDVVAKVAEDRNRWDDAFDDAEAAGRGHEALGARLADARSEIDVAETGITDTSVSPSREPVMREAEALDQPRIVAPTAPPVQVAALEVAAPAQEPVAHTPMETVGATAATEASAAEPAQAIPFPKPRPADFARMAQRPAKAPAHVQLASLAPDVPPSAGPAPRATALAYASPDAETKSDRPGDFFGKLLERDQGLRLPNRRSGVALYDIASATVRLPNGEKLEAHSGLGHRQDNPAYVREKNRGPTPPNVYDLRMREALFHGAAAIRLLPRDQKKVFNRDGLLAHPYMYVGGGSRSQSNGCVVFKDYGRFLRAFKAGEIARLVVVPNINELPSYMAGL